MQVGAAPAPCLPAPASLQAPTEGGPTTSPGPVDLHPQHGVLWAQTP